MDERWIVFGGWAFEPEILKPLFSENSVYIDVNSIMNEIIGIDKTLASDWPQRIADRFSGFFKDNTYIAGWSSGAMIAYAVSSLVKPDASVLISPTLSFCRRDSYHFGSKPSLLQSMRLSLQSDKIGVLERFASRCGMDFHSFSTCSQKELENGLYFLEYADLRNVKPPLSPIVILHASNDVIVPPDAGKYLSIHAGAVYKEFDGPHAFFINNYEPARREISSLLQRL
jgi:pimeloyl-ACP methyl ester carboxylesterase